MKAHGFYYKIIRLQKGGSTIAVNNNNFLPILSAITTSVIFGLSFLFSKQAIDAADPLSLLAFRFLTAFIVMSILVLAKIIRVNYKNKNLKGLLIVSFIQPLFYFICYGSKNPVKSELELKG